MGINAFVAPKPYPSWLFNEETADWDAPIERPEEGVWIWNESASTWDEIPE